MIMFNYDLTKATFTWVEMLQFDCYTLVVFKGLIPYCQENW